MEKSPLGRKQRIISSHTVPTPSFMSPTQPGEIVEYLAVKGLIWVFLPSVIISFMEQSVIFYLCLAFSHCTRIQHNFANTHNFSPGRGSVCILISLPVFWYISTNSLAPLFQFRRKKKRKKKKRRKKDVFVVRDAQGFSTILQTCTTFLLAEEDKNRGSVCFLILLPIYLPLSTNSLTPLFQFRRGKKDAFLFGDTKGFQRSWVFDVCANLIILCPPIK